MDEPNFGWCRRAEPASQFSGEISPALPTRVESEVVIFQLIRIIRVCTGLLNGRLFPLRTDACEEALDSITELKRYVLRMNAVSLTIVVAGN